MPTDIKEQLEHEANTEAGKALAPHGFRPVHQGGGLINYERRNADGSRVVVIVDAPDGWGPEFLSDPVVACRFANDDIAESEDWGHATLADFLATLK